MRALALFVGLLLAGCGSAGETAGSEAETNAAQLGRNCYNDTDIVPIERSGNCLALLRVIRETTDKIPPSGYLAEDCLEPDDYISDVDDAHLFAIANSLWNLGKPSDELLEGLGREPPMNHFHIYRDLDLMEQLFADYLELEREQTKLSFQQTESSGFQPAHTSENLLGLREGQLCLREGYTVAAPI